MKNKVIALSLLITALSVVPAFADTNSNCNSIDLNNSNSNYYILKKGVSNNKVYNYLSNKNCNINISDIINNCINNGQTNRPNNGQSNRPNIDSNKPSTDTNKPNIDINKPSTDTNKPSTDVNKPNQDNSNNGQNNNQNTSKPETNKPSQDNSSNSNSSVSSYERQVVELVNAERAKNGLSPLALDSSVSKVARVKSQDMATNNYFSHTSPTYGGAGNMLKQFGIKYTAYGENIASGQKTPQQVVSAWMNSSGHRANILSSSFTKIGVGYATNSSGKAYWTQMFIR